MTDRIAVDIDQHVAVVTLARPEKQNALDFETFEALAAAGEKLKAARDVRVVVLRADGEHFCAGMDVSVFQGGDVDPALLQPLQGSDANFFQKPAYVWRELAVPVVCAVKGNTLGGGLQIAAAADIRIASPDARLSVMEVQWGLVPDLGITTTLRDVLPLDVLKLLTFTGKILSGNEAHRVGLVTEVAADPDRAAWDLAKSIAGLSPDAVRGAKRLLNAAPRLTAAESLRLEADIQARILTLPNTREAMMARLQKRVARFGDADIGE